MNPRPLSLAAGIAALFLILSPVFAASNRPKKPAKTRVTLEQLGAVPARDADVSVSPLGNHVATVTAQGSRVFVSLDGRAGARYDDVLEIAPEADHTTSVRLRDVIEPSGAAVRAHPRTAMFSPDGSRLAYVARRGRSHLAVVDGRPGTAYERIAAVGFSPDSSRFAYVAETARRETHVVVDDILGPAFANIESFVFSGDGSRYAYVGITEDRNARLRYTLIVDGEEWERAGLEHLDQLTFSPDGRHFAYVKNADSSRTTVIIDGRPGLAHPGVIAGSLRFSDDSVHFAYFADTSDRNVELILDGRRVDNFDQVFVQVPDTMRFEPDGSLVFLAIQDNAYVRATCAPDAGGGFAGAPPVDSTPPVADASPAAPSPTADGPIGEIERTADQVGQALDAIGNLFGTPSKKSK